LDVSGKPKTERSASARGVVTMRPETLRLIRENALPKRDPIPTARAAGCLAAKRTPDLIPDCHPIALTHVDIAFDLEEDVRTSGAGTRTGGGQAGIVVVATVKTEDRTGVEMEALSAAAVACLTVYDMAKGVDPGMTLSEIALLSKTGGRQPYAASR
jgi:cyclic pyranopterin phosphate synthase